MLQLLLVWACNFSTTFPPVQAIKAGNFGLHFVQVMAFYGLRNYDEVLLCDLEIRLYYCNRCFYKII